MPEASWKASRKTVEGHAVNCFIYLRMGSEMQRAHKVRSEICIFEMVTGNGGWANGVLTMSCRPRSVFRATTMRN